MIDPMAQVYQLLVLLQGCRRYRTLGTQTSYLRSKINESSYATRCLNEMWFDVRPLVV